MNKNLEELLSHTPFLIAMDNYTLSTDYGLPAYVFDPGIRWEDYTADFGHGLPHSVLGYMVASERRGARNPYVWHDTDSVTSHEIRHFRHYIAGKSGVDEESRTRQEERIQGWGSDYSIKLV